MKCKKCGSFTEGINALCYACQLKLMNEWLTTGKNRNALLILAEEYDIRVSTVMNILAHFGVLHQE
jgi:hypothetical protein